MEKEGISNAILSLTAPGVQIVALDRQPQLARQINEYAAKLRDEHTGLGFFAALPSLFDTKAAISEIAYALDILKADGVTLFTRYGDGNFYLGDARFRPIWHELNIRRAVVFIHPTHPVNGDRIHPYLAQSIIDYPHETTRTAVDLIITNTKRDFPDCKVILSHAGGTLPILFNRAANGVALVSKGEKDAQEFIQDVMTFYFDLALSTSSNVLDTLLKHFPHDQLLYGSDFPYAPVAHVAHFAAELDEYVMSDATSKKIKFKNALKLFPRLSR
jgi:predicted TIM-barrel fold metal-dependent hydrolase